MPEPSINTIPGVNIHLPPSSPAPHNTARNEHQLFAISSGMPRPFSSPLLTQFLQTISSARNNQNHEHLGRCLLLSPASLLNNPPMNTLMAELRNYNHKNSVERVLGQDWPGFVDVIVAYLEYVKSIESETYSTVENMLAWFHNLKEFTGVLNPVFNSVQGTIFVSVIKSVSALFASSALRIDALSRDPRCPCSEAAMNVLLRSFNSTLGERTIATIAPTLQTLGKKAATIRLANDLFKLYFKVNQIRLCATIHSNIKTASIPSYLDLYSKSEQCTYHYYHGRHYFYADQFLNALSTFEFAYGLTRPGDHQQRKMIARYMIAAGIILGKFPSHALLARPECTGLGDMFLPICHAIRLGDFRGFRRALGDEGPDSGRKQFWIRTELYLTLKLRCQILLWRGLVRRTFLLTRPEQIAMRKKGPPTLDMRHILILAKFLHGPERVANPLFLGEGFHRDSDSDSSSDFGDDETSYYGLPLEMVDVECAIISLLDQGFIKGYIARQSSGPVLVLGKSDAFPPVAELYREERFIEEDAMESDNEGGPFSSNMAQAGGGHVVRLSGVKPIGFKG
ncbi:hypothetical protein L873DRAFT_1817025 [Choiromyces venosus 120613-1]|uniref:PCI domain-containing protein n=1 Tax=Choiromyces venosus 120613-1 TaxID=1336337 RepID=A0A3N4J3J3_9PEZI|nr:hypothetical protein L873DRAFT_1817025 [Choiromyces venosus 120613-1]